MDHLDDVKYAKDEYVDAGASPLDGWSFRPNPDGTYEADGPCPTCHGDAYGPRLAEIEEPPAKELVTEDLDVGCECHCGHDHGGGSDSGCGRWWIASHRVARP